MFAHFVPALSFKTDSPYRNRHQQRTTTSGRLKIPEPKHLEAIEAQPNYIGLAKAIRKLRIAGIFQHYYPEGGWGFVVLICAVLVQVLAPGLQLSLGMVMNQILTRKPSLSHVTVIQTGRTPQAIKPVYLSDHNKFSSLVRRIPVSLFICGHRKKTKTLLKLLLFFSNCLISSLKEVK